jgi:molybdenum cofactor cytidylyltransferase
MTQRDTTSLEAIVLAAGRGLRFGGGKLLAPLNGAPLVTGALRTAFLAPVRRVFVAIGPDPALRQAIEDAAARAGAPDRLAVVEIHDPSEGMGESLRTATAALPDDAAGVFVLLGDMPAIHPSTPTRLARAFTGPDDIVAPTRLGQRGHPVLFGATWFPALRGLSGDEGARTLLRDGSIALKTIAVDDPGIHLDVDRPEDLVRVVSAGISHAR